MTESSVSPAWLSGLVQPVTANCYVVPGMTDSGKVWLVGAGPGTPELLTVQGRELLEQATVVVYDAGQDAALFEGCRSDVLRFVLEQLTPDTGARLVDYARHGHRVVWLCAPDAYAQVPAVLQALEQSGVAFALVPGIVTHPSDVLCVYDNGPLAGKRLLLPRPIEQARISAKAIRLRGAVPIVFPLLAIEEPEDTLRVDTAVAQLSSYDWVLLTSANGAEKLISAVQRAGLDARAFGKTKIGVIGPKTAEPLKRFGLIADLVAEEHVAEGLLLALSSQQTMRRVLIFRAAEAREVLPETLRASGIEVDVVAGYRTRRLGAEEAEPLRRQLREGKFDAVLVTSSSMGKSLVEALAPDTTQLLERSRVASIGPVTTETLEGFGVKVAVVAKKYTVEGLLDALEDSFRRKATEESC